MFAKKPFRILLLAIVGCILLAFSALAWTRVSAGPEPGSSGWYTVDSNKTRCIETSLPAEPGESDGIYLKTRTEKFREWTGKIYKIKVTLEPAGSDIFITQTYYRDIETCKDEQVTERWWWTNIEATLVPGATIEDACVPIDGLPDEVKPYDLGEYKLAYIKDETGEQMKVVNSKAECVSEMEGFLEIMQE